MERGVSSLLLFLFCFEKAAKVNFLWLAQGGTLAGEVPDGTSCAPFSKRGIRLLGSRELYLQALFPRVRTGS